MKTAKYWSVLKSVILDNFHQGRPDDLILVIGKLAWGDRYPAADVFYKSKLSNSEQLEVKKLGASDMGQVIMYLMLPLLPKWWYLPVSSFYGLDAQTIGDVPMLQCVEYFSYE